MATTTKQQAGPPGRTPSRRARRLAKLIGHRKVRRDKQLLHRLMQELQRELKRARSPWSRLRAKAREAMDRRRNPYTRADTGRSYRTSEAAMRDQGGGGRQARQPQGTGRQDRQQAAAGRHRAPGGPREHVGGSTLRTRRNQARRRRLAGRSGWARRGWDRGWHGAAQRQANVRAWGARRRAAYQRAAEPGIRRAEVRADARANGMDRRRAAAHANRVHPGAVRRRWRSSRGPARATAARGQAVRAASYAGRRAPRMRRVRRPRVARMPRLIGRGGR